MDEVIANEPLPYIRFEELGYTSTILHRNTGCILYVYSALAGFVIISLLLKCKDRLRWANKYLIIKGIQLDLLVRRFVFPFVLFSTVQILSLAAIANISHGPIFTTEWGDFAYRSQYNLSVFFLVLLCLYPLYMFFSYWFGLQAWNLLSEEKNRQLEFDEYITEDPTAKKVHFKRRAKQILKEAAGQGEDDEPEDHNVVQIIDEAQLNVAKQEKLKAYSVQRGVLVRGFHVQRLISGLLYLGALSFVQVVLSFTYVRLASYVSFQFMIMCFSLTFLMIVCGWLNPFAHTWDKFVELANITIHVALVCVLSGCSSWGLATTGSVQSRRFVNGWIFSLFILFIALNFITILVQAILYTRSYYIRWKLDRYYAKIERENNNIRVLQNKV